MLLYWNVSSFFRKWVTISKVWAIKRRIDTKRSSRQSVLVSKTILTSLIQSFAGYLSMAIGKGEWCGFVLPVLECMTNWIVANHTASCTLLYCVHSCYYWCYNADCALAHNIILCTCACMIAVLFPSILARSATQCWMIWWQAILTHLLLIGSGHSFQARV